MIKLHAHVLGALEKCNGVEGLVVVVVGQWKAKIKASAVRPARRQVRSVGGSDALLWRAVELEAPRRSGWTRKDTLKVEFETSFMSTAVGLLCRVGHVNAVHGGGGAGRMVRGQYFTHRASSTIKYIESLRFILRYGDNPCPHVLSCVRHIAAPP